jgi:hypothetical protein
MTPRRNLGFPLYVLFINASNALSLSVSITVTKTRGLAVRKREIMSHVYKSPCKRRLNKGDDVL